MILEGLVTTENEDGSVHVAAMGPRIEDAPNRFTLRPYQTSTTFSNLERRRTGVFHITDNVELLARAVIGQWPDSPKILADTETKTPVLADICRWREFEVREMNLDGQRAELECEVVQEGRVADFFGFNRAKHAVVEAAILATRVNLLSEEEIRAEFSRLSIPVEKTAGDQERRAFAMLKAYVEAAFQPSHSRPGDA